MCLSKQITYSIPVIFMTVFAIYLVHLLGKFNPIPYRHFRNLLVAFNSSENCTTNIESWFSPVCIYVGF